jgi:hypothetical protein
MDTGKPGTEGRSPVPSLDCEPTGDFFAVDRRCTTIIHIPVRT